MGPSASVKSPVTGGPVSHWKSLQADVIVNRYRSLNVDVSRYYKGMSSVPILKCEDTGYRFFYPPELAGEADFYDQLHDPDRPGQNFEHTDYRSWSDDYQFAFDRLEPGERLLDIGCGHGYFLDRARERTDAFGLEGNPHAHRICIAKGLKVELGLIQNFGKRHAGEFDTVCAFQVLEHVYDVRSFIDNATAALRPGGRLIIAVPNNEPFVRRFDPYCALNLPPHHVGLWNRRSLERMGRHFGLEMTEHDYCETSDRWMVEAYLHARMLTGVTSEIHHHSSIDLAKIIAASLFTLPISLGNHLVRRRPTTGNVIAAVSRKPG